MLEVLIAGGILFIVSGAIVGLNNSIIRGTAVNADVTILNRWASEGLELTAAHRDDNLLAGNNDGNNSIWLNEATDPANYGWYTLSQNGNNWALTKATGLGNTIDFTTLNNTNSEAKTSQSLTAFRLICLESVGAVTRRDATTDSCNTSAGGSAIASDGDRSHTTAPCDSANNYCTNTQASLNRDELSSVATNSPTIIPAGNAVKVRSVVVTSNKTGFTVADVATLLTNWKGFEQTAGFSGANFGTGGSGQ